MARLYGCGNDFRFLLSRWKYNCPLSMFEVWMYGVVLCFAQRIRLVNLAVVLRRDKFAEGISDFVVETVSAWPAPCHYLHHARHHHFQHIVLHKELQHGAEIADGRIKELNQSQ